MNTILKSCYDFKMQHIHTADGFLICTGAGMSHDSGIPVYRRNGRWGPSQEELDEKYPGLSVEDLHDFGRAGLFDSKGELFWRYFRDLRDLFMSESHQGYYRLNEIISKKPHFVVTSNIDHMHIRSGLFPLNVIEVHGSLIDNRGNFFVQCSHGMECNKRIWKSDPSVTPRCPSCNSIARPNVLSFHDENYFPADQFGHSNMVEWLKSFRGKLVILEIGVGNTVKTITNRSRSVWKDHPDSVLIRVNPEPDPNPLPERYFSIETTALEAIL